MQFSRGETRRPVLGSTANAGLETAPFRICIRGRKLYCAFFAAFIQNQCGLGGKITAPERINI